MSKEKLKRKFEIKGALRKLNKNFIRDRWGNLTDCYWNEMTKEDILKLEDEYEKLDGAKPA